MGYYQIERKGKKNKAKFRALHSNGQCTNIYLIETNPYLYFVWYFKERV